MRYLLFDNGVPENIRRNGLITVSSLKKLVFY